MAEDQLVVGDREQEVDEGQSQVVGEVGHRCSVFRVQELGVRS